LAESVKIRNTEKTVLIPVASADCDGHMVSVEKILAMA
jgi:quinolinate synthase